jgi:hypothetical protein
MLQLAARGQTTTSYNHGSGLFQREQQLIQHLLKIENLILPIIT